MALSKDQLEALSGQLQRLQDLEEYPAVAREAGRLSREYAKRLHTVFTSNDERYNGFLKYYDDKIKGLEIKLGENSGKIK